LRKSIFDVIFEKHPNSFPDKPSKKERKKIYDQAFTFCSREYEADYGYKPKKADIEECLEKRIIFLLGLFQEYKRAKTDLEIRQIKRKKKRELGFGLRDIRGHSEKCNCELCNPDFEPIPDSEIRGMEEDERKIEMEKEALIINEGLRERFNAQFCSVCGCNPCICREES